MVRLNSGLARILAVDDHSDADRTGSAPFAGFIASFYTHEEDVKKWLNSCCGSTPSLCRSGRCRGLYPAL